MSENLSELSGRKGITENLFDELGQLTMERGAPDPKDLERLADSFLMGKANIYGATTFYDFLKPENQGKKIYVCNGTACLCAGTQDDLLADIKQHFTHHEIGHMTCLGRCHENRAFHYQGKNYSGESQVAEVILNGAEKKEDHYLVRASGPEILTAPFNSIQEYYQPFLDAIFNPAEDLLQEIIKAQLRGRGGAGFPIGLKLDACRREDSKVKFIICNADEGDPGAYSDRYLLEQRPHAILLGMLMAGFVAGAEHGIVYIRAEYPDAVRVIEQAIGDLRSEKIIGRQIAESDFNFDFKVIKAQGSYICGEETALINSIEGQRPEVRIRPPYPTQQGLFNKPTVVNNVETLAALPYILKNGAASWRQLGTERSTGTKLICLDGFFNNPGVYEVEMGTPLTTVIDDLGGGFRAPVKALQIGGPLGGLIPIHKISDLSVDFETFADHGFLLGHASIVCVPIDFPILKFIEHLFDFASYESCGKCFPCRLGTKRGQEMAEMALAGNYKIDRTLFEDLLKTLEEGSLCAHGGGIPLPVRNALQYFEEELRFYFS